MGARAPRSHVGRQSGLFSPPLERWHKRGGFCSRGLGDLRARALPGGGVAACRPSAERSEAAAWRGGCFRAGVTNFGSTCCCCRPSLPPFPSFPSRRCLVRWRLLGDLRVLLQPGRREEARRSAKRERPGRSAVFWGEDRRRLPASPAAPLTIFGRDAASGCCLPAGGADGTGRGGAASYFGASAASLSPPNKVIGRQQRLTLQLPSVSPPVKPAVPLNRLSLPLSRLSGLGVGMLTPG